VATLPTAPRQRGAVAILVALSLVVLVGMLGLAVDAGQLYVTKTELQSAADACALAAAQELNCQSAAGGGSAGVATCDPRYLLAAEAAGIHAATRNKARLQSQAVAMDAADVRFSTALAPNTGFRARSAGASQNSRFAMCIARANGLLPWVMGVTGAGASSVSATGVAVLAPSAGFCSSAPMGLCRKTNRSAPDFGYSLGEWVSTKFTNKDVDDDDEDTELSGSFKWVDFSPSSGGTDEIRDQLLGGPSNCGITIGQQVQQVSNGQGARSAYNTRFGIYASGGGYSKLTAPPDSTGYAYPNKSPGSPRISSGSAYADYIRRVGLHSPFVKNEYTGNVAAGKDVVSTASDHDAFGANRRLVSVPVITCGSGSTAVLGMACVLMLNPMHKGSSGNLYVEYRGNAAAPGSACTSIGTAAGPGGAGPLVPTLVQ
jgi:Flp pilus assembly protein TadG